VDNSVYLAPGDTFGLERLAQYILRCPFSLARVVRLTADLPRFKSPSRHQNSRTSQNFLDATTWLR
jgi:hypothetical protein